MKIEVYLKRVYGIDRFYPANSSCEFLCKLLRRKTLTSEQLSICREWGCEIKIVPEVVNIS